jgi:hypothetical protein
MAPLTTRKKSREEVPVAEVVALFKEHFKRGPWPDEVHCYRLTIDINAAKRAQPQAAKYRDKTFADRLKTFNEMQKLCRKQLEKARREAGGSCRWAWCSRRLVSTTISGVSRIDQAAAAGRPTRGSSLTGAKLSRVM